MVQTANRQLHRLAPLLCSAKAAWRGSFYFGYWRLHGDAAAAKLELQIEMAMEFAKTALHESAGADDSWLPRGTRSFLLSTRVADGLERLCDFC